MVSRKQSYTDIHENSVHGGQKWSGSDQGLIIRFIPFLWKAAGQWPYGQYLMSVALWSVPNDACCSLLHDAIGCCNKGAPKLHQ